MRRILLLVFLLALVLAGIYLGGRNDQPVTIDYLHGTVEMTLAVALVLSFLAGLLLGAMAVWLGSVLRLQSRIRKLRRELNSSKDPSPERLAADE